MVRKLQSLFYYFIIYPIYKIQFAKIESRARIFNPTKIEGKKNIHIHNNVIIGNYSWLASLPLTNSSKPKLIFSSNCRIGNFNHIYCTGEIVFEKGVLTADKVYVSDNLHGYEDIHTPIFKQPIKQLPKVTIGEGSWLGENVCVIGASVGKQSIIGANSVVTKDIPDYCVAVGSPARIIKRYCIASQTWKKTDKNGNFL
jgi:acetyltransferase-like isoleucine patch superfamily enzyme